MAREGTVSLPTRFEQLVRSLLYELSIAYRRCHSAFLHRVMLTAYPSSGPGPPSALLRTSLRLARRPYGDDVAEG